MARPKYRFQGSILEACSCSAPCPCWIGDDPHGGVCDAFVAYRIEGKGTLKIGDRVEAKMAPYTDAKGRPTTLANTIFSTIPGSPAYVARAAHHRVHIPEHGMEWTFENRNAIEGSFRFAA